MFTKRPIDGLTNNIIERLNISSTKRLIDKIIYESNPQNADFDDLHFDGAGRLITRRRIYRINDDIVFGLNNDSIVYV